MATERKGTETATRVADVLMLFTDGPDSLGVTAIARALGLSKTVVHRTLSSLVERGFLVSEPRTREYALGPSLASLGARALRESSSSVGRPADHATPPGGHRGDRDDLGASARWARLSGPDREHAGDQDDRRARPALPPPRRLLEQVHPRLPPGHRTP